ncbi:MAG: hypothetical protein LUD02_05130 [Tannerellaceae bacterium]|nr:hypothetical protein [Tannerellaceae bacterium]MCD8263606.1 hypothetical protein [Tannerellaceae bacterium]
MMKVLQQFICDECGLIISSPEEGFVEWLNYPGKDGRERVGGFRIVHHGGASPWRKVEREGCYRYGKEIGHRDLHLDYILPVANAFILHFLNPGYFRCFSEEEHYNSCQVDNFYEFTDFARRLTIPYYEEAQQYFPEWVIDEGLDFNPSYFDYTPDFLQRLIERYGRKKPVEETKVLE